MSFERVLILAGWVVCLVAAPTSAADRPVRQLDVRYATDDDPLHTADITTPIGPPPRGGYPVVLVIHGGAWISGDKWTMTGFTRRLADAGMVAVAMNYRLAPAHPFPRQIDDASLALRWIAQQSSERNWAADRIGVWGYSAGAQIALVAATADPSTGETTRWANDDPRWAEIPPVQAVVGGGAPCEFRTLPPGNRSLSYWLGGTRQQRGDVYAAASPAAHLDANDPPILLLHGTADVIVPVQSARSMTQAAKIAGAKLELKEYVGDGHVSTFTNGNVLREAVEFLRQRLAKPMNPPDVPDYQR